MKYISRHLPPLEQRPLPALGWIVLTAGSIALIYWIATHLAFFLAASFIAIPLWLAHDFSERQRRASIVRERKSDICTFRKSFDVRRIDPWIIRATHEELTSFLWNGRPFPIRADDRIDEDLEIEDEDLDDIASDIAQRAGYSMTGIEQNPLYGRVLTVRDLVLFFTHQTKLRDNVKVPAAGI